MTRELSFSNKVLITEIPSEKLGENTRIDKLSGVSQYVLYHSENELKPTVHFLTTLDHYYFLNEESVCHIHFRGGSLIIYLKLAGNLCDFKIEKFKTAEDVLYMLSEITDSINENDKNKLNVNLSGDISDTSEIYNKLAIYYGSNLAIKEGKSNLSFEDYILQECV